MMSDLLSALLILASLWSKPVDSGCTLSASYKGDRALMSCKSEDGLTLSVTTADGRSLSVDDIDAVLRDAVPTGLPEWSPSGRFVALEVGLDEEPGVLLIDASDKPSAVLIDRPLIPMQIAAAGPQWHSSGDWLVFHTSGAGGALANEGVYALRLKDRAIFRLLTASVRSMALSEATLYVVRVSVEANGKGELLALNIDDLMRKAVRVVPVENAARTRHAPCSSTSTATRSRSRPR
jgi:hypothetical protein